MNIRLDLKSLCGSDDRLVQASLPLLAAMFALPFLYPYHYDPIGSFRAEWVAALCGLLAATALLSRRLWQAASLPAIALLPLGLGGLALLQLALGIVNFPQQTLLLLLYLSWALLLLLLGAGLRREVGLARLCDWLAGAAFTAAMAAAVLALLSHSEVAPESPLLFSSLGMTALHGNVAQPNHFANQLWVGIAAALYLCLRGLLRELAAGLGACALIGVSILTGSRATLLYLIAFVAIAAYARRRWPGQATRDAWRLTLVLVPFYVVLQGAFSLSTHLGWLTTATPVAKVAGDSGGAIRLQLLGIGWRAFLAAPWLGHGVGSFAPLSLAQAGLFADGRGPGGVEHAHDLPMDLLVELGIAAPLLLLASLGLWLRGLLRAAGRDAGEGLATGWLCAALAVQFLHSLVEYPLWYSFFLGPTALLLGIGDARPLKLALARRGPLLAAAVLAGGAVVLYQVRDDYRRLELAVNPWLQTPRRLSSWEDMLPLAETPWRDSLLYPYFCPTAVTRLRMPPEPMAVALDVSECAMRVLPVRVVVFRRALVLAFAGQTAAAEATWRLALRTYPAEAPQAVRELRGMLARNSQAPLAPLLAIAEQTQAGQGRRAE